MAAQPPPRAPPLQVDNLSTSNTRDETPTTTREGSTIPLYFQQQAHVQAQLRNQRINAMLMIKSQDQSNSPPQTSYSQQQSQQQIVYSPYPFPPSEHPLPPRQSSQNQTVPISPPLQHYLFEHQQQQQQRQRQLSTTHHSAQIQHYGAPVPPTTTTNSLPMEYRFPTSSFNSQYVVQSGFQIQPTSQQYFTRYSPSSVTQQQQGGGGGGGGARLEPAAEIIDSKGGENLNSTSYLNLNQLARPRPRHPIQTLQQGEDFFRHTSSSSSSSSSLTPPPGLTIPQRYSFGAAPTPLLYDQRRPHSTTIIQDLGSSSFKDERNNHESRQIYSVSTSATPVPLPLPPQQLPSSPPVSPSRKEDVIHVIPSPPQQQEQRNLAAFPFSVQNITPSTSSFPPSSSTAQLILPPPGGITPATLHPHPSSLPISPPQVFSSTTLEDAIATCQVEGCQFPRFCCLSPCGDMICRDHLGSVIRGVKLLPKQKRKGGSSGREEDEGEIEMVKVFECVRCRKQSEMVGPTPHQQRDKEKLLRERQQRQMVNNLPHQHQQQYLGIQGYPHYYHYGSEPSMNMVGLGIDSLVGEIDRGGGFSIHYLSTGPSGGGGGGGMSHDYQRSRFAASSDTTLGEVSHHKSRPVPDSTNPPNSFPKQTSHGVGLVSKPPSPPYPVQFYGSPESEASIAQSYYQPSFEGSPTAIRLDVDSLESIQIGAGTEIRIELEPQEVIDADYQPSPSITSQKENAGETPPLSASSSTPEVVIFEDVESQTVEPFLLDSPPIPTSRCLPVPIVSTPPSPATTLQHLRLEEEAVHLLSEDPSIVSVSRTTCSRPQTPTQEIKKPLESDWSIPPSPLESPISPSVNQSSPQAYTASPFPAFHQHPSSSSSFADISTSPTRGRGRGTRGSHRRGGSRGWDPNIARERRGSIAATTTTTASSIQEEQDDSGWNFVETRQEPEVQLEFHKKRREQVEEEFRGKYSIVKIENIPFSVTYRELQDWLPRDVLPPFEDCPQPIHMILHRALARTLPHCYIEVKDDEAALRILRECDREMLINRTVRVKMERVGEFMRDIFDQSRYFINTTSMIRRNLALDPLPSFPSEGYHLPSKLLDETDLTALEEWMSIAPWSSYITRPSERGYTMLGTILTKFPFTTRPELWNETLRDRLFSITTHAIGSARATKGYLQNDFTPIADRLVEIVSRCPGFTESQCDTYSDFPINEFPPLASPARRPPIVPQQSPPISRFTHPPASSWNFEQSPEIDNTSLPAQGSALEVEEPSPETNRPDWLQRNSSSEKSSTRSSTVTSSPRPVREESPTIYWAEELPQSAAQTEGSAGPTHSTSLNRLAPSVSIPRQDWVDSSTSPVTPLSQESPSPSLGNPDCIEYPLTPPESPETTRPRYSKGGGGGGRGGRRGRGGAGWRS